MMALLALAVSAPAFGQAAPAPPQNPPGTPAKQPGTPGTPQPDATAAAPVNAEEEAAYKALADTKDNTLKAKLGEEFQQKYPTSRYREMVFVTLSSAYQNLGQADKMFAACEKAIEVNPDSVAALVTLVKSRPRRIDPKGLGAQQELDKVEKYGKHALELIAALPKPENVTEEAFIKNKNYALADVHSGLGLTYMHKQRLADSISELEQATKISDQPDPVVERITGRDFQSMTGRSDHHQEKKSSSDHR